VESEYLERIRQASLPENIPEDSIKRELREVTERVRVNSCDYAEGRPIMQPGSNDYLDRTDERQGL
jgi:hypothetical protein